MAEIDEINARLSQSVDTAEDLKNTIENVAKTNDVEVVKGTDTPKSVVEKMGQQLGNIDSISELNLTYGEESPTYDTTDGMTVRATGQLKYGTDKTTTFDTEFNLPLVPADNSITIGVDESNKKFTIKSNSSGKDNLLVVYNDDKTAVYCKRILSVPDIQANTKFDLVFGTTPIQGVLDITVIGKLSEYKNVGSITRHIGVDYQGETTSTIVYKDHNYTQVDKNIAQYIFVGDSFDPLVVDSRGLSIAIENNVESANYPQSLQDVEVIVEYTSLKTENLDVNWLLNIIVGESSVGTISAYAVHPSGYVGSVQTINRIYGTDGGGGQKTYGLNNGGLEYSADIPRYYNGQIGTSEIPSPLNELQDDLYTTASIYAIVNGGYLQKCVTLKGITNPTSSTQAYYVGQLYLNTTNNALWICSAIGSETPKTYTWKLLGDGLDTQPRAISTQIYDNTTLASHIDEILGHVNTENGGSLVSISMKLTNAISGEMKSVTTNLSTNTLTNSTSTVNIINAGEAITLTLGAIRNGATSGKKATFICANDTNMCSFSNIAISNINDTDTAILSGYEFTYGTNSIIHNYFNDISILNADLEHLVINYYAT